MKTKPTYRSLEPQTIWLGRGYSASRQFNAGDWVSATAVAAIRKAFTLARTGKDDWRTGTRYGRPDVRQGMRAARGAQDVFKHRNAKSATRVRASVLIDASGSMRGQGHPVAVPDPENPGQKAPVTRAVGAAVFGATVVEALSHVPTVTLDIYQHAASSGDELIIKHRWARGTPLAAFNESILSIGHGGNADGHALFAVGARMKGDLKRGERGVIMVVSDGLPSVYSRDGNSEAGQALIDAVAAVQKMGIDVVAVAIDGSDQSVYYGAANMIPFTGDWTALGQALARRIGKAMVG